MTPNAPAQTPSQMLERAIALHDDRRYDEAKSLYLKVLEAHPHHAGTRHMLGLAEHESGQFSAAIQHLKKAAAAEPRNAIYAGNLGVAYKAKGDLERAVTAYKKAIGIDPSIAALHHNLGVALAENGDHHGAAASFEKALALDARYFEAETGLGMALMHLGEIENAIARFRKALTLNPEHAPAHRQLGLAYIISERDSAAAESLGRAAALSPDPDTFTRLGETLYRLTRFDEAISAFSEALALKPNDPDLLCLLARSEAQRGQPDQAEQLYLAAIGGGDSRASTFFALAEILDQQGRQNEAIANCRHAIRADPDFARAHLMLSRIHKFTADGDDINLMRAAFDRAEPGSPARMYLGFALGKAEEDLGNYRKGFGHLTEANRLRRQSVAYDAYRTRHWTESIIALFDAGLFARNEGAGQPDAGPLFVIGLPHSGANEVARLLSAHPAIHGAGELHLISDALDEAGLSDPETLFSDRIAALPAERFGELGRTYLSRTKHLAPGARYILNQLPGNFWRVGIIRLMLPNARIVHCRRNPVDNCLSIFTTHFEGGTAAFGYDLGELGTYHTSYRRLMAHWHEMLPGWIYDLDFEALRADREAECRKLLNALGLEWDDALFRVRPSPTANLQPAGPEQYGEALRPLLEALADKG